jgi:hypothetical protein
VREMGAARILIPIGSHMYIVRYISDDIAVKLVSTHTGGRKDRF